MIGRLRAVLVVAALVLIVTLLVSGRRDAVAAATITRYQEVKDWPSLPPSVQLGEAAGVAIDANGHVFIFHRPGRGFDLTAATKLTEPTVLEIDANTGKLISFVGREHLSCAARHHHRRAEQRLPDRRLIATGFQVHARWQGHLRAWGATRRSMGCDAFQ